MTAGNGTSPTEISLSEFIFRVLVEKSFFAVRKINENKMAADMKNQQAQKILKDENENSK